MELFYLFSCTYFFSAYICFTMKNKTAKSKDKAAVEAVQTQLPSGTPTQAETLADEAFLQDAEKEPKRILLADHIRTITTLRDKKRLTFRAIAEWFGERGLETDQSAVYRAYLTAIPEAERDPREDWSDVREPDFADENITVKKANS